MPNHFYLREKGRLLRALSVAMLLDQLQIREGRPAEINLLEMIRGEGQGLNVLYQKEQIIDLLRDVALQLGLDPNLALAIADHETGFDPYKVRYEPKWKYLLTPDKFARPLSISLDTEIALQRMSFGVAQVMGSVCRELGFKGNLTSLIDPQLGVLYGMKKLKALSLKYPNEKDLISSYNAGSPRLMNGRYSNQPYVTDVLLRLQKLRQPQ